MSETTEPTQENKNTPKMQVSVEQLSDIERKVAVEIPWDDVKSRLDEAYQELQQGVTIKGFRKGKVPRKMLERLFGKHVTQEVAQRMVQESIPEAMSKENISAVSEPEVTDDGIKEGEVFKYSAVLQVLPEVEPKDYFGTEVKVRKAKIADEDIERALLGKQREMTDYRSIEGRNTQQGDVLLVDIMGKSGDQVIDKEQEMIELTDPPREPLPGLAKLLTDIPTDQEELSVELDIPVTTKGEEGETAATEKAKLLITIKDVKQKIVPELNDDFAKDTGEAETLEGLKEVLGKKLLAEDEKNVGEEAKQQLMKNILAKNDIPVVPALVERYLDQTIQLQMSYMGIQPGTSGIDENALKEGLRGDAEEKVKSGILLEAIAKKENVEIQDADVEQKLAELAAGRSQNVARIRSEYEKEGRMTALRGRIREDKTLDLLMAKANTIEDDGSPEPEQANPQPEAGAEPTPEGKPETE